MHTARGSVGRDGHRGRRRGRHPLVVGTGGTPRGSRPTPPRGDARSGFAPTGRRPTSASERAEDAGTPQWTDATRGSHTRGPGRVPLRRPRRPAQRIGTALSPGVCGPARRGAQGALLGARRRRASAGLVATRTCPSPEPMTGTLHACAPCCSWTGRVRPPGPPSPAV